MDWAHVLVIVQCDGKDALIHLAYFTESDRAYTKHLAQTYFKAEMNVQKSLTYKLNTGWQTETLKIYRINWSPICQARTPLE